MAGKREKVSKHDSDSSFANRRGVQSIDVGMSILEVLAASSEALPLKRISEAVDMAPSNVHRYLASFVRAGLLRQDPATSRYDLGRLAMRVGLSALARIDILELARPELLRLSETYGLLTVATVFGDHGPTVVRMQQCNPAVIMTLSLGSVLPLLRSPSGQICLAYMPEDATRHIVERELVQGARYPLASSTPKTFAEARRVAQEVRKTGYAMNDVDVSPGLRSVACPVLNLQNELVVVLSLTGPDPTLGADHPALADLISVCRRLSEEAGFRER